MNQEKNYTLECYDTKAVQCKTPDQSVNKEVAKGGRQHTPPPCPSTLYVQTGVG